jgi:DNA-binding NarL/FixJ family response regulator
MKKHCYDVLVAEDEAVVALEIRLLLARNNYNVVGIVKSGENLLKEFEKKNPDIIISDINLEGKLDGIDAAKIIHKSKDIPVIFITGDGDNTTYIKALTASPSAFLLKPFSERKLLSSVKDSIETLH